MNMRIVWLALLSMLLLGSCGGEQAEQEQAAVITIEGKTMGTYYRVVYIDSLQRALQPAMDSALLALNAEVNTYDSTSLISRFNRSAAGLPLLDAAGNKALHFLANLAVAKRVYGLSGGYYDCSVMPLVNYWGFGYTEKKPVSQVDSLLVDSLRQLVGMPMIVLEEGGAAPFLRKQRPGNQLDFSSCAKGYGTDLLALLLEERGINNYLVDIGGELRARGHNAEGNDWQIGVSKPVEGAAMNEIEQIIKLRNQSMATSGNYRNFFEVNGQKYAHTINPLSGFPERSKLLSATIVAADCMTADAFATASMAMGLERAVEVVGKEPGVEGFFIYAEGDQLKTTYTEGMKSLLVNAANQ